MNIWKTFKYIRKNELDKIRHCCQVFFYISKFRFCKIAYGDSLMSLIIELRKKKWIVYRIDERGGIHDSQEYESESEACEEYLIILRYFKQIK